MGRSDKLANGSIYRPYRPHTNPTNITPGTNYEYLVEIFPIGHVFRAGHRLTVIVEAPPAVDSYYAYAPQRSPAAVNTLSVGPAALSRLMLPVVPPPTLGPAVPCGQLDAVRCVPSP